MAADHVERLRGVYAEWSRGNLGAGGELFAPDLVFEPISDGRTSLGRDEVAGYMRDFLSQWREFRLSAESLEDYGDRVLVTELQRATGEASGITAERTFYSVWTFRGAEVVSVRWFADRESALAVASALER